jgi:hypothetical protein
MFPFLLFMMADTTVATQSPPRPEKMICKRQAETGSLVRFRKICRTESKWRQVGEQAQDEARNMQDRGLINSCSSPPC